MKSSDWLIANLYRILWSTWLLAMVLVLTLAATADTAQAHKTGCKHDIFGTVYGCRPHKHYRKVVRRRKTRARVRAYSHRDEEKEYNWTCKRKVRAVGSQWIDAVGAKKSAIKAWREAVRFDYGERYGDWANAKGVAQGCSRSSIGQILGKVFYRCEISATPCRAPLTSDGR